MKFNIKFLFLIAVLMQSCWGDRGAPNYEYMPNMYESLSYESYSENNLFEDNLSARLPVEGTIPRGYSLYDYEDTNEGYESAKKNLTNEDYEKFFTLLGDKEIRAMGLDPDEIRIKMDQILDWNASSVKEMSAEDVETDKTLVKSKLDN